MPRETHPSICRFCHANCGILVEVEDGRPVRVTGDSENPAYFGFTCAKGRHLPDQHAHPERLLHSQKRVEPRGAGPRFEAIPSAQAMDEIAAKIGALVAKHGPRAVALYPGTYSGPHPASIPAGVGFMLALGSKMVFTSAAIDQPGKHVANAIHGRWLGGSHVFDESDVWLLVGNNPLISMSGGIPPSNPSRRLRKAKARGLKLIVIDPRKTEVARFADLYLQPRAGEDPAILAAMLHVVIREGLVDSAFVLENVAGFDALAQAVADCTPEWAAARAGLEAREIVEAARLFAEGPRGCAVAGTGPNMAPHGNLTEYLLLALNTLCGRWRRAGERVPNPGALLPPALGKAQALGPRPGWGKGESLRSRPLGNSAAGLPTAALADEILWDGQERIRALLCLGSNPVAAWPDQRKAEAAMKRLELLVCLDPKLGATSKLAHYVIAPKLSLEVPGLSVSSEGVEQTYVAHGYPEPYAQYSPAIVAPPPGADVLEEWEFFYGLCQRMGLALTCYPLRAETGVLRGRREAFALDMQKKPSTDEVLAGLMNGSRIPLDEIKRHPHGAIFADARPEHAVVAPADPGSSDRLDVGNADMLRELVGIRRERIDTGSAKRDVARPFQLISRRLPNVYNSSGRDIAGLQKGRTWNPAFLHPADLAELGLAAGDRVEIASDHDAILGIVEAAPELRRGVVSMTHCYGEGPGEEPEPADDPSRGDAQRSDASQDLDGRLRALGSSTGRLVDNMRDFDPYTGIPRMSAIPVSIRRA